MFLAATSLFSPFGTALSRMLSVANTSMYCRMVLAFLISPAWRVHLPGDVSCATV